MLQEENNQVLIEFRLYIQQRADLKAAILKVLSQDDCVAHNATEYEPFTNGPESEAAIAARFLQDAVAEAPVDAVEEAQAKCHTLHLGVEAQVNE